MKQVHVTGGNRWKEAILKRLGLSTMGKGPHVKVGILSGATYSQDHNEYFATEKKFKNGNTRRVRKERKKVRTNLPTIAEVAFWNEYGTKTAPARPFFRNTDAAKRKEWVRDVKQSIKDGLTLQEALDNVGKNMAMDIVETIKAGVNPPLADFTINQRWANKIQGTTPLMASREMAKAISHEVTP